MHQLHRVALAHTHRRAHSTVLCVPASFVAHACSYDFETRGVARLLRGHTAPVISLSWNASSHHLLSACTDGTIIRWNVLAGTQGSSANVNATSAAAAATATATDANSSGNKSKTIKRVQLHPTIESVGHRKYERPRLRCKCSICSFCSFCVFLCDLTSCSLCVCLCVGSDLALLTFSDGDHPLLVELDPLPVRASEQQQQQQHGTTTAAPSSSPHTPPAPAPDAGTKTDASQRLPLWSRYVTTPYVVPASQVAAAAAAAAAEAAAATPPDTPAAPTPAPQDGSGDTAMTSATPSPAAPAASGATSTQLPLQAQAQAPPPEEDNSLFFSRWTSTVALFDRTGRFVFEGNNKGTLVLHQLHYDAALHARMRSQRAAAAVAAAASDQQSSDVGSESLPPYLSLRVIFVEALPQQPVLRRVRGAGGGISAGAGVQALVQSNCGRFLLVNIATALKVYRIDTNLLQPPRNRSRRRRDRHVSSGDTAAVAEQSKAEAAEAALDALAAQVSADAETQEILLNGARVALPERERKLRTQRKLQQQAAAAAGDPAAATAASAAASVVSEADIPWPQLTRAQKLAREKARKLERKEREALARRLRREEAEQAAAATDADEQKNNNNNNNNNSDGDDDDHEDGGGEANARHSGGGGGLHEPLLDYLRTLSDQVNRVPWRRCAFSASGEFVLGGSAERGEHRIHIWSLLTGQLTKMLSGSTEALLDLASHPRLPLVVTACSSGSVYLWTQKLVENWSAFAPDFEELDDNREYVEREDEFDLRETEDPKDTERKQMEEKRAFVDVLRDDDDDDEDDEAEEEEKEGATTDGGRHGVAALPPRTKQLVALPTTIQPDAATAAAYAVRRAAALAKQAQAQVAAAASAAAAAAAAAAVTVPSPSPSTDATSSPVPAAAAASSATPMETDMADVVAAAPAPAPVAASAPTATVAAVASPQATPAKRTFEDPAAATTQQEEANKKPRV
jgi:hypothetical protein